MRRSHTARGQKSTSNQNGLRAVSIIHTRILHVVASMKQAKRGDILRILTKIIAGILLFGAAGEVGAQLQSTAGIPLGAYEALPIDPPTQGIGGEVAISGRTAVVAGAGEVYILEKEQDWELRNVFRKGGHFGKSVAVSGDAVIVGDWGNNKAYI